MIRDPRSESQTLGYFDLITGAKTVSERDPKEDPVVGDEVRKLLPRVKIRKVVRREGGNIWYVANSGPTKNCWITTWQDWCKGAEIINRGHP